MELWVSKLAFEEGALRSYREFFKDMVVLVCFFDPDPCYVRPVLGTLVPFGFVGIKRRKVAEPVPASVLRERRRAVGPRFRQQELEERARCGVSDDFARVSSEAFCRCQVSNEKKWTVQKAVPEFFGLQPCSSGSFMGAYQ